MRIANILARKILQYNRKTNHEGHEEHKKQKSEGSRQESGVSTRTAI
jgi:hypothetical protein